MTNATDTDIKEIKQLITNCFEGLNREIKQVKDDVKEIKTEIKEIKKDLTQVQIEQGKIEGKLEPVGKITDLAERIGELKNWRQIAIIVISSSIAAFLGWLVRGSKF
ncbi:MAG: hypothetical protein QNJ54_30285 [Prochloraceae cyanobacterium]|nr:hypothetical protein [Prochloraceae cyanobacterium]